MRRRTLLSICATGLFISLLARPVLADAIHFNTDTGVMTINGNAATDFFGVLMQKSVVGGVQQFRFLGDLNFIGSDVVTASGLRPLSLWAGNNVNIASGAVFNFDAAGQTAKLGGGNGGSAVSGGAGAGSGGSGGPFAMGGAGGAGGVSNGDFGTSGEDGGTGSKMNAGTPGGAGSAGQAGSVGQAGFNNISIATAGAAGTAGAQGSTLFSLGDGGFGGDGGGPSRDIHVAEDGGPGADASQNGFTGGNGGAGGNGGNGGSGQNDATGFILSGGAGGASGGSGGGGGGGGGGSSGRGGGGGGGGGGGQIFVGVESGADGGPGGFGGQGGFGGNGTQGVGSGRGGAGGGAIEIAAQGRLNFAGTINIRGAAGVAGTTSASAGTGTAGVVGLPGLPGGTTFAGIGGDGGAGGDGSAGGNGGNGGRGGNGGHGGGGAGGTVMFKSSLFSAAGGTINAGGGFLIGAPGTTFGGNGRYVVSDNGAALPDYGEIFDASEDFHIGQAARDTNPLIQGSPTTPNMTQIVGGADIYGLIDGIDVNDFTLDDVRANAPLGATAALVRRSAGPYGDQYLGHDMLMLVNLTESALASPVLGIGPAGEGYQSSLPQRGFARNPAFGGSGPETLTALPAESVYATLVPGDLTDYEVFGYAGFGRTVSWDTLDVAYLGPPIYMQGDFDLDGDVDGRDFLKWQRGESFNPLSAGDLADWQANYGVGMLTATSVAVPEPAAIVLVGAMSILFGVRRCRI